MTRSSRITGWSWRDLKSLISLPNWNVPLRDRRQGQVAARCGDASFNNADHGSVLRAEDSLSGGRRTKGRRRTERYAVNVLPAIVRASC